MYNYFKKFKYSNLGDSKKSLEIDLEVYEKKKKL